MSLCRGTIRLDSRHRQMLSCLSARRHPGHQADWSAPPLPPPTWDWRGHSAAAGGWLPSLQGLGGAANLFEHAPISPAISGSSARLFRFDRQPTGRRGERRD